jgi:hypothetical protein
MKPLHLLDGKFPKEKEEAVNEKIAIAVGVVMFDLCL